MRRIASPSGSSTSLVAFATLVGLFAGPAASRSWAFIWELGASLPIAMTAGEAESLEKCQKTVAKAASKGEKTVAKSLGKAMAVAAEEIFTTQTVAVSDAVASAALKKMKPILPTAVEEIPRGQNRSFFDSISAAISSQAMGKLQDAVVDACAPSSSVSHTLEQVVQNMGVLGLGQRCEEIGGPTNIESVSEFAECVARDTVVGAMMGSTVYPQASGLLGALGQAIGNLTNQPAGLIQGAGVLLSAARTTVDADGDGVADASVCSPPGPTTTSTTTTSTTTTTIPRFVDNGDGTVTDNEAGVMWQKSDTNGCITDASALYTWQEGALTGTVFSEFLAGLNGGGGFAGHSDWRLPTIEELETLVEDSECYASTFGAIPAGTRAYWSDTPGSPAGYVQAIVRFSASPGCSVASYPEASNLNARAVRDLP